MAGHEKRRVAVLILLELSLELIQGDKVVGSALEDEIDVMTDGGSN